MKQIGCNTVYGRTNIVPWLKSSHRSCCLKNSRNYSDDGKYSNNVVAAIEIYPSTAHELEIELFRQWNRNPQIIDKSVECIKKSQLYQQITRRIKTVRFTQGILFITGKTNRCKGDFFVFLVSFQSIVISIHDFFMFCFLHYALIDAFFPFCTNSWLLLVTF